MIINHWQLLQYRTYTGLFKMRKYLFVPNPLRIGKQRLMTPPHPPVTENFVFYCKFRHLQRKLPFRHLSQGRIATINQHGYHACTYHKSNF